MLGIYNYTVILTYMSVVSAGLGMYFSSCGEIKTGVFFLMFSGLCDMLDGPVARTLKNRTQTAKNFGIQIDSLCDCVSFGVQPAVLYYFISKSYAPNCGWLHIVSIALGIMLMLCAVIRLAFFNVCEEERQSTEGNKLRTGYRGLPVTNVTWIIPLFYLAGFFAKGLVFAIIMAVTELATAILFIVDFPFPKIHGKKLALVGVGGLLVFVGVCFV